ncbi:hypothetical protein LCGC14_1491150 [marine sediment metagenome]|uniref:Uncharacterized protein n=1 Tax=marine sediment metagenome TaxID=412755 RepID=A0A0F9J7D4_9ZZZZ
MEWQGKYEYIVTNRVVMEKRIRADSAREAEGRALDGGMFDYDLVSDTVKARRIEVGT